MIVFRNTIVYCGILLSVFSLFHAASGAELVGIAPLTNQRYQVQDDWLGFYIQARIKANLSQNSDWQFHGQNAIGLWALRLDRSLPISPQTTILIDGSFQQVADLGFISLHLKRYLPGKGSTKTFEQSFSSSDLDRRIDELSLKAGRWIQPEFGLRVQASFPRYDMVAGKELFTLRLKMFKPGSLPDVRTISYLEEIIDENSHFEMIQDLGEGLMVMSQSFDDQERRRVLGKIEVLLRKAILKNRNRAGLYALLAEVYFLADHYNSWVEKTAADALGLDPQNDLALILRTIIKDSDAEARSAEMEKLRMVNPWLFSDQVDSPARYQKGLLKRELSHLKRLFN